MAGPMVGAGNTIMNGKAARSRGEKDKETGNYDTV